MALYLGNSTQNGVSLQVEVRISPHRCTQVRSAFASEPEMLILSAQAELPERDGGLSVQRSHDSALQGNAVNDFLR